MKEKVINKKISIALTVIFILILIVIGSSYAYFTVQANTDIQTVTTGTLTMGFTNGNLINADTPIPINDSEIKTEATTLPFSITNTGNQHMKITIKLTDIIIDTSLKNIDFRWGLYNADTDIGVSFGTFKYSETGKEELILRDVILDSGSTTKNYKLRVWIHENGAVQNDMMGQSFSAKVSVTGEPIEYTPETCFTFSNGTITRYNVETCGTDVVIPRAINGTTVTQIGESAFSNFPNEQSGMNITSVIIPDTINYIENFAFAFNNLLTYITIPESVTNSGTAPFFNSGLTSAIIPENFKGDGTFNNSKLKTIVIPSGASLRMNSFSDNILTDVVIMDGITSIEQSLFINNDFTSIEVPTTINDIKTDAFSGCENLTEIVVRGKSSLSDFTDSTGLTTAGGLPEGVTITFRP